MSHWRRLGIAVGLFLAVLLAGTIGYVVLGFSLLDALYQTVTTVSTVGFREVQPLSAAGQVFTMVLILLGVGAALYAFSVLVETLIEGRLNDLLGRRRMERNLNTLTEHVIVCGFGRVGRSIASELGATGKPLVIVDLDAGRVEGCQYPVVIGDATDDTVLATAGVDRASTLVAAVEGDAANSFITLSARALRPDLFIVARARGADSTDKLLRAGADRVVNPQSIGGSRMAAFVLRPNVAEFLDVVMHEQNIEFHLEELPVETSSPLAGVTLREARIRDRSGALVLALRESSGEFISNPSPDTAITPGQVLIAIGTDSEIGALAELVGG